MSQVPLNQREIQIYRLLGRGLNTRAIAQHMTLNPQFMTSVYASMKRKWDLHRFIELQSNAILSRRTRVNRILDLRHARKRRLPA